MRFGHALLSAVLLFVSWTRHADAACPRKCRCDSVRQVVDCTRSGLTHIPWDLPDPVGIKQLILSENHITQIISEIVSYSNLELLDLSDNSLMGVDDSVFDALPKLKILRLHNNRLSLLNENTFKGLVSLQELDLSHNQIVELRSNSIFAEMTSLTHLSLMGNELRRLQDDVFMGLESLRILNLSDNRLSQVPVAALRHTSSLSDLSLDFNNIETLHLYRLIANIHSLSRLSIDNNKISTLTWESQHREDTNTDLPELRTLSVKFNKLTSVPTESLTHLKNLFSLDLSGNLFPIFKKDSIKGLEHLEFLHLNSLAHLKEVKDYAFAEISTLTTLEMHSNRRLSAIAEKAFLGLPMLKRLDLHANDLKTLAPNAFEWLDLEYLDLRYNEWICDCNLKWLHELLKQPDVNASSFYASELYCNSPEELASRRIKDVKEELFVCHKKPLRDHVFEERVMLGIFVSFTIMLVFVLICVLFKYKYFTCLSSGTRHVPQVNYHANIQPMMNGHCNVIPCHVFNDEQIQIAANEVQNEDDDDAA